MVKGPGDRVNLMLDILDLPGNSSHTTRGRPAMGMKIVMLPRGQEIG